MTEGPQYAQNPYAIATEQVRQHRKSARERVFAADIHTPRHPIAARRCTEAVALLFQLAAIAGSLDYSIGLAS